LLLLALMGWKTARLMTACVCTGAHYRIKVALTASYVTVRWPQRDSLNLPDNN
jgi:hypothetical protein